MLASDADQEVLGGVSLEQFAGVMGARAEGVPLEEVLDQERIDLASWPQAKRLWTEAIAESVALQVRLRKARRIVQDCLARSIRPLQDDEASWAGLLEGLRAHPDPDALLTGLGLSSSDVDRLGRHWAKRMVDTPGLADRLSALAGKAPVPEQVEVEPVRLRPFPWTPPPLAASSEGKGATSMTPSPDPPPPALAFATFQRMDEAMMPDVDETLPVLGGVSVVLPFIERSPVVPPAATGPVEQSGETVAIAGISALYRDAPGVATLESYIDLAARLRDTPEDADRIFEQFGLPSPEHRQRAHALWRDRFASERGLKARFEEGVAKALSDRRR